jgi:hypothetical protein
MMLFEAVELSPIADPQILTLVGPQVLMTKSGSYGFPRPMLIGSSH